MENSSQNSNPELEAKMNEVIAEEEGYGGAEPTPEEQERYLKGYSFSALVFSVFYFGYMKDKTFLWLSIVSGIVFFPVLFVLPFFARKRAWQLGQWRSFNHFLTVQKKWDKWAVYGAIVSILVFFYLASYEAKILSKYMGSSGINNMNDIKQFQDELQGTIGN